MATYLVLKRIKEDRVALPGELLIDPPNVSVLITRGYLIPVPDNYPGAVSKPLQLGPSTSAEMTEMTVQSPTDSPPPPSQDTDFGPSDEAEEVFDEIEEPKVKPKPKPAPKARPVARVTRRR